MFFSFKSKGSESDFLFHFKCVHVIVLNCYNFFKIIFFQLLKEKFWISRYFINRKNPNGDVKQTPACYVVVFQQSNC